MILEKWPELSPAAKGTFLGACTIVAAIGFLIISGYVLSRGLGLTYDPVASMALYPKLVIARGFDGETGRWVKIASYAGAVPALGMIIAFLMNKPKQDLHGKARFAENRDIKAAALRSKSGLIAGFTGPLPSRNYGKPVDKMGRHVEDGGAVKIASTGHLTPRNLLTYGGPEHMFIYAPTRSGKGVAVVVPNLLNWPGSAVVLDIKKENWTLTAGFRQSGGQDVYLFDPLEPNGRTHRWNPLSTVRRGGDFQIEDLQRLADLFIPVQSKDPFFDRAAQTAFVGVGGYLAETPRLPFTLGEIFRQLTLSGDVVKTFKDRIKKRKDDGHPLSWQTEAALTDFISKSENTFESVKSTITANLGLFANPLLDRATSASDFDFADLRKRSMSIYVGITPNNLGRLGPLLNLFFQSCVDANMQELPENNPELKHKVLLCMDEFAAVGELPSFKRGIGYFAGYGLKVLTIIQTPAQLSDIYGADGAAAYMDNAGVEVVFTPKSLKEARNLSERFGTLAMESKSESRSKHLANSKGTTVSTSEQKRSLMMPQELLAMDQSKALVIIAGQPPVMANKLRYYAEEVFLERSKIAPPEIPSISPGALDGKVAKVEAENLELRKEQVETREELAALREELARITALAEYRDENVANGQPASVEMTTEEITNPGGIMPERLKLDHSSAREKLAALKKSGKLTSQDGAKELLTSLGVDLPHPAIA
ncbi:type IV secretory system conjugative DNA transfer family protein [Sulfitobacter sp. DFL-23]|uniref:Conjugal transfer protein TraG n=2 Tax=Pseudosulfitobacter pseudonitzschiae TaxID=1402135 RepID=A0A221K8D3_9RHOB|nr:type IV secretory system conjugative DNA transfer family protein [Sulfitobacter sp. DFL-23]ASM75107.1 conjugal transfer protein TraG [Pseudosulfitobacter pseudonitzschiae]